jgi:hypothetical protein
MGKPAPRSAIQFYRISNMKKQTYQIGHSFELNTASHAARGSGFFDTRFISFGEDPDGVVRMTEDPEIVTTNVGQLLQIRLVNTRTVQGIDELVRRKGDLWRVRGSWSGGEQEGAEERIQRLVWIGKGDCVARACLPYFAPWRNRSD